MPAKRRRCGLRVAVGGSGADSLAALAGGAAAAPAATVEESDVAVILYTSGTTGHPKGAMLTHLNIVHSVLHYQACMRLSPDDRSALAVPASHVTGLIAIVASMLRVGGTIVIVPAFKAAEFVRLIEAERISHTLMVPAMYNLCLLQRRVRGTATCAPGASAAMAARRCRWRRSTRWPQRLPGLTLLNAYGATETTSPATMMPAGLTREHADSVGVALPAADIRVMDDDGREVRARPDRRAVDRRADGRARLLGQPRGHRGVVHRRLLAFGRPGLGRCARLRARLRPQEGHAQPRRLQDLFGRGRERADGLARHGRGGRRRQALPGARRARARLRACAGRRGRTTPRCARFCAERLADYKVPETLHLERRSRCRAMPTAS